VAGWRRTRKWRQERNLKQISRKRQRQNTWTSKRQRRWR
jgi:hypothetical protein